MKKLLLLTSLLGLIYCNLLGQNFQISGGNDHSVMICANSRVFAWGNNQGKANAGASVTTGKLGTGDAASAIISTPKEVLFPVGLSIRQVDAGSGEHSVALDCNANAWGWGGNEFGQTGQPGPTVETTPKKVPTGLQGHASGFLSNVTSVSGGNSESFAILSTKEVMSWGTNSLGQLGNGTTTSSSSPVYVLVPGGARLTNVIKVEAADATGFALVDPDGDGIGTVYSWGDASASQLGRPSVNMTYAMPVVMADNVTPLSNIVDISAGDVHCLALDALGNVWAWGNGGWGGLTGTNAAFGVTHVDPRKVVGGQTGLPYLSATKISAGQGFSMAVTSDGHAVTWGNNGGTTSGGNLGDCGSTSSPFPVYINTAAATPVTGVSDISDGDFWGFLIKNDGTFWTWGGNNVGQLGIGNTTLQSCLVQLTPASGCALPDLKPTVNLTGGITKCPPFSELLKSNFPGTTGYTYKWYKNGVLISGATTTNYTATSVGLYKVEISYTGTNAPCGGYPVVKDSVTVAQYVPTFTIPSPQTACVAGFIQPYVSGTGLYYWYTESSAGVKLDTTTKNALAKIPYASVTHKTGSAYTVYVEEISNAVGKVAKMSDGITATTNSSAADMELRIVVYEDIYLDSLNFRWKHTGYSTASSTITINFYDEKTNCGGNGKAADRTKLLITGPSITLTDKADNLIEEVTANMGGITLTGSPAGKIYWIGFSSWSTLPGGAGYIIMSGSAFPFKDDITGNIINVLGSDNGDCAMGAGDYGVFYDLSFRTMPKACGRFPVTVTSSCPAPVTFLYVEAEEDNAGALVKWATAEEKNSNYFIVQKSSDGEHWGDITKIKNAGNSSTVKEYSYLDTEAKGIQYYRIVEVNASNNKQYSEMVSITKYNEEAFTISPNPNNGIFTIRSLNGTTTITLEIFDMLGNVVYDEKEFKIEGARAIQSTVISKGIYLVRITEDNKTSIKKLVVE